MHLIPDIMNRFFSLGPVWIGAALIIGLFVYHALKHKMKVQRRIELTVLLIYVLLVFFYTVLARASTGSYQYELRPFWSYKLIEAIPDYRDEIFLNYVMFVPIGLMTPGVHKHRDKYLRAFTFSFALSALIETLQLLLTRGFFEIDDIIGNTIGGAIGIVLCYLIKRLRYIRRKRKHLVFKINHRHALAFSSDHLLPELRITETKHKTHTTKSHKHHTSYHNYKIKEEQKTVTKTSSEHHAHHEHHKHHHTSHHSHHKSRYSIKVKTINTKNLEEKTDNIIKTLIG